MSTSFSDLQMILEEVIYWLIYDLSFFGITISILQVFFACALLSLTLSTIVKMFTGGGD